MYIMLKSKKSFNFFLNPVGCLLYSILYIKKTISKVEQFVFTK